ncbi:tryptophan halogenase family protein [Croceibacterium aestuarii]|uniref:tryptophan halogenase family protein n=1 Tax=Croceibacterium aestuarii TaxID=3064139 RepID=UPI00272E1B4E|nr:tryptophan halogenase family protein [Croceibacterium sp. D39]
MDGQAVKRVVIAGGGTAGWTVAAALAKNLGSLLEISLVESDAIGTVGVGESTIPTARRFHELLGIDERSFVCATQASFKLGIAFEDWAKIGDRYFHAFGVTGQSTWLADFHHVWLQAREQGLAGEFGDYCLELQAAEAGKFEGGKGSRLNYAYHLDASAYGRFLRAFAEPLGVRRIEGKIAQVDLASDTGFIEALVLESAERVAGDLFIDCTGFRGLLIEEALATGYEDWTHWLPTDSALAVQTEATGPARPYTRAIARPAGWQWQIPLQKRVGNGLVFCSRYLSDDEAHAQLARQIEGAMLTDPRLIRFRAGTRRKAWNRNCIAIGLASGFVEPLESTSIHLIMIAVTRLMQLFPFGGISEALISRYNEVSRRELESIRDFIVLHYHLNERDEEFWRECRTMDIPDTLAERLALFRDAGHAYQAADELFRTDSWVQVMLGQRLSPRGHHAMGRLMRPEQLSAALANIAANIDAAVARLPQHQTFLDRFCGHPSG